MSAAEKKRVVGQLDSVISSNDFICLSRCAVEGTEEAFFACRRSLVVEAQMGQNCNFQLNPLN